MLQIHLNKSSSGGGGAAAAAGAGAAGGGGSSAGDAAAAAVSATSSASASETNPNIIINNNSSSSNNNNNINMNNNNNNNNNSNSNVTVSCAEHLVLADLLVAKGLGTPPSTHSQSNPPRKKSTVGRKRPRTAGTKTHICVCCDFPIAIYGRLIPCHHAFCLTCARSEPTCYLCDQRIQKIVSIKLLDGLFICGAPHCLKSFLKKYDFEQHLKESHIDLLQPASEKQEKDVVSTIPPAPDAHYKPQLHAESQALSRLVAAPVNQGSQQVTLSADSPSMRSLLKRSSNSMSVVPPPMQKQILGSQSTVAPIPTSATPPYEKQVLPNHMSAIKIPEQSFDKKQMEYPESQLLAPVQSFEKQSLQSTHTHYQRQASETHQSPQQQTERRQADAFSQQNQGTSLGHVARGMPANHTANMPQYGSQPYSHPYSISSEGKQHMGSSFDPRYGSAKSTNFHSSNQNMQENNQRYPVQTQFVPQFQDNQHITQQVGSSMFPNSASASISNPPPHEGYMYLDRQTRVSNNQGDVGQVPGVLQAHFPQPYSEVHSSDISHVPLPKHRHYPNLANHANNAANHGWNAARTNYGGHGYGNWMGQSGN